MSRLSEKTIIALLILVVVSCGRKEIEPAGDRINVTVSIIPYRNFVELIGGDKVEVNVLIPAGASPHTFEPTAMQLKQISGSDIYFRTGGNFHFEEEMLGEISADLKKTRILDSSDGIELIDNNPHVWLSPDNIGIIVRNIKDGLIAASPNDSLYFSNNYKQFTVRLDSIDVSISKQFEKFEQRTFLVYHGAWKYFADHYGLEELAIEREGKEPGINQIRDLVETAKNLQLKYIYINPRQNPEPAMMLAGEINADIDTLETLPSDCLNNLEKTASKIIKDFR